MRALWYNFNTGSELYRIICKVHILRKKENILHLNYKNEDLISEDDKA